MATPKLNFPLVTDYITIIISRSITYKWLKIYIFFKTILKLDTHNNNEYLYDLLSYIFENVLCKHIYKYEY